MDVGMNLPVMAPGWDRDAFLGWCRAVDRGPWSCLALGERINFSNPDAVAALAAAAVATERVPLVANVVVPALHPPALLAKQLATVDVLSGGRLVVGVGVGGREEDYLAVGADWDVKRLRLLEDRVGQLRGLWAGEPSHDGAERPVEPAPVQPGGPRLLAGSLGPRSIRRAATWADGLLGFSFLLGTEELEQAFALARSAWAEAGRDQPPHLATGSWFAIGETPQAGRAQLHDYLRRYLAFLGEMGEAMVPLVPFHEAGALLEGLRRARDAGADELLLTPTSWDLAELDRAAAVVRELR